MTVEVRDQMDPMEAAALAIIALGDLVILIALACALLMLAFSVESASSSTNQLPSQIVIIGWLGFQLAVGGLLLLIAIGSSNEHIDLTIQMSLGIKVLLLLITFILLDMGTSVRSPARGTGK